MKTAILLDMVIYCRLKDTEEVNSLCSGKLTQMSAECYIEAREMLEAGQNGQR